MGGEPNTKGNADAKIALNIRSGVRDGKGRETDIGLDEGAGLIRSTTSPPCRRNKF